jgi:hypothetical protein
MQGDIDKLKKDTIETNTKIEELAKNTLKADELTQKILNLKSPFEESISK